MKIIPTVGRVVWYHPGNSTAGMAQYDTAQPMDAHVVYVWGDDMVNLLVVDHAGATHRRTSVPLVQEGGVHTVGPSPYCEWMPYQKGQAAKADTNKAVSLDTQVLRLDCLRLAVGRCEAPLAQGDDPLVLAGKLLEFITK